jgi:hypothetical protein
MTAEHDDAACRSRVRAADERVAGSLGGGEATVGHDPWEPLLAERWDQYLVTRPRGQACERPDRSVRPSLAFTPTRSLAVQAQPVSGTAERNRMSTEIGTLYSRDSKWLWTGEKWVALPAAAEEPATPRARGPHLRNALGLLGLIVFVATMATVTITIVRNV